MAKQFAVVYMADRSLVASGVGPFRTLEKAESVMRRIDKAAEWLEERDDLGDGYSVAAQVVTLGTLAEALAEISEPTVSGSDQ